MNLPLTLFQYKNMIQLFYNYHKKFNDYLHTIFDENNLNENYFITQGDEMPIFMPFN